MSPLKFPTFRTRLPEPKQLEDTGVAANRTPLERIYAALGARIRPDDTERADLPVGIFHEDVVPVSGSILIGTGKVISRAKVDQALDKALKI